MTEALDGIAATAHEGFEQVVHCEDEATGLRSIIAIHDTTLGPALGGVRMHPYADEAAALRDCLRLAKGMTLKAAAAGVDLGGGKSVIIGDPQRDKSEALFLAHGRWIQTLGGRYIPGIDVGTEMADLEVVAREAERVSCIQGDPSPMTALGVLQGMLACCESAFGEPSLSGVRVCVQGAGHVGSELAALLCGEGAEVIIGDVDTDRAEAVAASTGARPVCASECIAAEVDVLAPCAMGGVIDDMTIERLRCSVIAGCANNVLESQLHGDELHRRGILYAPDFCINAGGLIFLEEEMLGHDREQTEQRVRGVRELVAAVFERSAAAATAPARAAEEIAWERVRRARDAELQRAG